MKSALTLKPSLLFCASLILPFAFQSASLAAPRNSASEVVIINTGDRLTPGYHVTVEPNGALTSVLVPFGQKTPLRRTGSMIPLNRQRLFADIARAEPLANLPTGTVAGAQTRRGGQRRNARQPAGASRPTPRPQIYLEYQGSTSPNLRAVNSTAGRVLYQDVKQILQVLGLPIPNIP